MGRAAGTAIERCVRIRHCTTVFSVVFSYHCILYTIILLISDELQDRDRQVASQQLSQDEKRILVVG